MKFLKIAGAMTIVIVALAILGITLAFAQKPDPTGTRTPWWNSMRAMMQGTGNWQSMQQMHNSMTQNGGAGAMYEWMHQGSGATGSGGVHNTVWAAMAEKLGLTSDELASQINSGKTLAQIAQEKGVSTKDLAAVMENAMESGLAQAVKDGTLTQAQADLMTTHMDGQYEWMIINMGAGMMGPGYRGGAMGNGGAIGNGGATRRGGMMGPGFRRQQ